MAVTPALSAAARLLLCCPCISTEVGKARQSATRGSPVPARGGSRQNWISSAWSEAGICRTIHPLSCRPCHQTMCEDRPMRPAQAASNAPLQAEGKTDARQLECWPRRPFGPVRRQPGQNSSALLTRAGRLRAAGTSGIEKVRKVN